jgi:prevent-host-death family protein
MIDRSITVTEAARHFSDLVNRTYYRRESTILTRAGEAVAKVVPLSVEGVRATDWIARWNAMPHLVHEDAEDFASCLTEAKENLSDPISPWD